MSCGSLLWGTVGVFTPEKFAKTTIRAFTSIPEMTVPFKLHWLAWRIHLCATFNSSRTDRYFCYRIKLTTPIFLAAQFFFLLLSSLRLRMPKSMDKGGCWHIVFVVPSTKYVKYFISNRTTRAVKYKKLSRMKT